MTKFFDRLGISIYYILIFIIVCIGLFLRIRLYLHQLPVWHDEVALSLNIFERPIYKLFYTLHYSQAAPPLFLVAIKIITNIFGINILSLRFIPTLAGCSSLLLFIPVLQNTFKSKLPVIVALSLFAICGPLIYYSQEIKPYSSDVFFCILILFLINKINFNDKKNAIISSILCFIIPLCSFPSVFMMVAALGYKFLISEKKRKIKYSIYTGIPFCLSLFILWLINHGIHSYMTSFDDWDNGFLKFSFDSFIYIISNYIDYLGYYSVGTLLIFLVGIFICFFKKEETAVISVLCFIIVYFASVFHLYPFIGRASIFFAPIALLFIASIFENNFNEYKDKYLPKITMLLKYIIFLFLIVQSFNIVDSYNRVSDLDYKLQDGYKHERLEREKDIITILDNFKQGDEIVSTYELYIHILFYNIMNKYNYHIDLAFDCNKFDELKDMVSNENFNNFWIVETYNPRHDTSIDYEKEYETILNNAGVKYKKYENNATNIYYVENDNNK
ncbi:glycosyltransferase family 39 protein [bacterium]|nr:glycosyltransferase family 39 protein [bacterium]